MYYRVYIGQNGRNVPEYNNKQQQPLQVNFYCELSYLVDKISSLHRNDVSNAFGRFVRLWKLYAL